MLVETGIGERIDDKARTMRDYRGPPIVPALETAGFDPATVDVVAMSHLHFDHAGGLLPRRRDACLPAGARSSRSARSGRSRSATTRGSSRATSSPSSDSSRDWGAEGWADGEREVLPGVSVVPTGGHSGGHQAIVVRGTGAGARLAFFGDLCMRPWSANPRWVTVVRRLPADVGRGQGDVFAQAADEGWTIVLSHEPRRGPDRCELVRG